MSEYVEYLKAVFEQLDPFNHDACSVDTAFSSKG